MAILGGSLGYKLLRGYAGNGKKVGLSNPTAYKDKSKIELLLGKSLLDEIVGKVVIDFGCGTGEDTIEMAKRGAKKVIGVDIQERYLTAGRDRANQLGLSDRCEFVQSPTDAADIIVAIDSFEHFENPADILQTMRRMLKPNGLVLASFGPTWYHPYGGHLFSVFPWAHLVFTERTLMEWRSGFKTDGATRFHEVEGGLNQMTIKRFKKLVRESPFSFVEFEAVPIRKLKWIANPVTQEFTTSIVRCKLTPDGN